CGPASFGRPRDRQRGADGRAVRAGVDVEGAADLARAFPHAGDADAHLERVARGIEWHAAARIADFQTYRGLDAAQPDEAGLGPRVTMDVAESFLHEAEQ